MCTPIGISGTIAIWLFGGLAATQLSSYTQNSYAHGKAKWYSKLFQKDPVDPNPAHTLNTYNLGASGGLMAMLGTISVWRGRSLWGIPLIPIAIQARVVGLCVLAWDYYGNYNNSMDGIGHNTHLCGMGIGAAIALFGLRRGKYAKVWKIVVKP
jgi:membrane associated rhomboid family serine protease